MLEKRICEKCGKEFEIESKLKNRFCSRSCANGHKHSDETKKKISQGVRKHNPIKSIKYCNSCGAEYGKCKRPDICKKHQIFNSLIKFGFNINVKGSEKIIYEFERVKQNIQNIYNNHPNNEDLLKFGYTSGLSNFHKLLKSLNIHIRTSSESQRESVLLGKNAKIFSSNIYRCGWHITWDNKEVYLRSSYELDYAKQLDEQQIEYEVENLRIKYFDSQKQEFRCAIPDFYLPQTHEIVEIKSNWTLDEQNMKDKFNAYIEQGYKPKLILNKQEVNF